jgi:hypothetical protein
MAYKIITIMSSWLKSKGVFAATIPKLEFIASSSIDEAKQSVYDTMAEITSSTPMSASMTRIEFGSLVRADYPELMRLNHGLFKSAQHSGSTLVHHDPISGSGVFISGSYYSMPIAVAHDKTHIERFELVRDAIEYRMNQNIATKKGIPAAAAEASASYTGSINVIKALP